MDVVIDTLLNLLHQHWYIFAFIGALFEGTYIMILGGVLFKLGLFNFWGLSAVLLLGYFLNGIMLYLIGRIGGHQILDKWGKRFHLTKRIIEKLERYFKKHSVRTLFITRITYGLCVPAVIMAGALKMNWKKFVSVIFVANFIWVYVMLGLGYLFGVSYEALGAVVKTISVVFVIVAFVLAILLSFLIVYWLRRFARTKFIKRLEKHPFAFLRGMGKIISNSFDNGKDK